MCENKQKYVQYKFRASSEYMLHEHRASSVNKLYVLLPGCIKRPPPPYWLFSHNTSDVK